MKKAPGLFTVKEFQDPDMPQAHINGRWIPARPLGYYSIPSRVQLAWGVFCGKYDVVQWPGGQ